MHRSESLLLVARRSISVSDAVVACRSSNSLQRWPPGNRQESRPSHAVNRYPPALPHHRAASPAPRQRPDEHRCPRLLQRRRAGFNPHAFDLARESAGSQHLLTRRCGIDPIGAGEHWRRLARHRRSAGEGSNLIQRRREGEEPVAGHSAIRWLQADHAANCGRLPDGSTCVGSARAMRSEPTPRRRTMDHRVHDRSPTDCARGRTRSSHSTTPSQTRRSSSCRR